MQLELRLCMRPPGRPEEREIRLERTVGSVRGIGPLASGGRGRGCFSQRHHPGGRGQHRRGTPVGSTSAETRGPEKGTRRRHALAHTLSAAPRFEARGEPCRLPRPEFRKPPAECWPGLGAARKSRPRSFPELRPRPLGAPGRGGWASPPRSHQGQLSHTNPVSLPELFIIIIIV